MLDYSTLHSDIPRNLAVIGLGLAASISLLAGALHYRKQHAHSEDARSSSPQWLFTAFLLVAFGCAWIILVHQKSQYDLADALKSYRHHSAADAAIAADETEKLFHDMYHDLHTIAALPGVRNIDDKNPSLDSSASETIQQLYNTLHHEANISEIYIVQASFDPDAIDARTKQPQEPYFSFDKWIGGKHSRKFSDEEMPEPGSKEEVEIFEYHEMKQQIEWITENYPTISSIRGHNVPMLTSPPLITCDNSIYNRSENDQDRTGIIFSVPFYSLEGKFRGVISAVLLVQNLQNALPKQHYSLINKTKRFSISSNSEGQQTLSRQSIDNIEPDPNLLYSEILPLHTGDSKDEWALWVGMPNSRFINSDAVIDIQKFEYMGYAFALTFTAFGLLVWWLLNRGYRLIKARNLELERRLHLEEAQRHVIAAKEAAERTAAVRSEFLANMSHELRTPLNSILGMLRLLKRSQLSREDMTLADTAHRSATNLLEIINDILDLSKIDAGGLQMERIGFDLLYALNSSVETLQQLSNDKNIPLVRQFGKESMPYVLGDPTRMSHIFINLISNAIKYTDRGHVEIKAYCEEIDTQYTLFKLEVKDTGIGIPEEKRALIFEKFVQADSSTTRKYGGTGLGLAITHQLVEMMGGKIGVDSVVGSGSTFWVHIPFEKTHSVHKEKEVRRQKALRGTIPPGQARVLIAEDHIMNQLFVKKLMQNFGITNYKIVGNGNAVFKAYTEKHWDVILMDCHMPEKNGYDTTTAIRDHERSTGKHVPIIAMTANAMAGDREKCLQAGMDEYMSKPIDVDILRDTLGQWIRFEGSLETKAQPEYTHEKLETLDLHQLRSISDGSPELEKEMAEAFVTQSDINIEALKEAVASKNTSLWQENIHMLKGGAAGIGALQLMHLSERAQHLQGDDAQIVDLLIEILSEYHNVTQALAKMGY